MFDKKYLLVALFAIAMGAPSAGASQAAESRTVGGAVSAARAWLTKPGNSMEHVREIASESIPRSELTCRADRPTVCQLTDGQPRFQLRAYRIGKDTSSTAVDSVIVDINTFTNERSVVDSQPFMSHGGYSYVYNYLNGHWVRGRAVAATAS